MWLLPFSCAQKMQKALQSIVKNFLRAQKQKQFGRKIKSNNVPHKNPPHGKKLVEYTQFLHLLCFWCASLRIISPQVLFGNRTPKVRKNVKNCGGIDWRQAFVVLTRKCWVLNGNYHFFFIFRQDFRLHPKIFKKQYVAIFFCIDLNFHGAAHGR